MTGRAEPSFAELRENLVRRLESLEDPGRSRRNDKRIRRRGNKKIGHFFRDGTTHTSAAVVATETSSAATLISTSTVAGVSTSVTNTAVPAATSTVGQTAVTKANPPTAEDSLGLDIESVRSKPRFCFGVADPATARGNDIGYLATIQIGTPPRDFHLLMDSGSADMWVGSENCRSTNGGTCVCLTQSLISKRLPTSSSLKGNHNFLGAVGSSTFSDSGKAWNITYGTGAVSGTKATDDVLIAGLALTRHNFGVANNESVEFTDNSVPFDGLVGLAHSVGFMLTACIIILKFWTEII